MRGGWRVLQRRGGEVRVLQLLLTQSFAIEPPGPRHFRVWSRKGGDGDQTGWRVFWVQEKGKLEGCDECRCSGEWRRDHLLSSSLLPFAPSPSSSPLPPLPAPHLLVYISPKDVIELNKAFLRGSCHSCCLWHVKRPATLRALTYAPN